MDPFATTTSTVMHLIADRARPVNRSSRLRLARELVRVEGVRSLVAKLLGRVVYRRVVVATGDMDREYSVPSCDVEMTIKRLRPEDVDAYVAFAPNADARTVERRLAAGSRIYAAWSDGRIVSAGWIELEDALFDAINAKVPIGPDVVYVRGAYTTPELRNRNIATVGYVTALKMLREEGFKRGVGFILPESRSSFGPIAKAGFERLGSLGWFGLGPFRIYFFRRIGAKTRFMPRLRRGRKPVALDLDLS